MGMNAAQIEWARLHLKPGIFIVQVAEGNWRHPFIVHVSKQDIPATVTDAEARRSLDALSALPVLPAAEFQDWSPYRAIEIGSQAKDSPSVALGGSPLDSSQLRFLRAVQEHPALPSSKYAKLAGLSSKRAIIIRHELVVAGFLLEHKVATGARGREAIILELSAKALSLLGAAKKGLGAES